MKYFLTIIRENLTSRFIFGHLHWCQRNTNLKSQCSFCCLVKRCYIFDNAEDETRSQYVLYHYQRFDEHHERIFEENDFFSKDLNRIFKKCQPFEHVYSYNQLNYFFVGRFKQQYMYNFFLFWSKRLFAAVCNNISKQYVINAIIYLRPIGDYGPAYLKISNTFYIDYIG